MGMDAAEIHQGYWTALKTTLIKLFLVLVEDKAIGSAGTGGGKVRF